MLVYFKVGNYKSVKEPIVINFNAASITEHPNSNVHSENGVNLIRSDLLYGHNGSGKSKIIDALTFFRKFIIYSVSERMTERMQPEPFALSSELEGQPGFFEASFILNKYIYRYGFNVDQEKVHSEWLLESKSAGGKEYPVFLRTSGRYEISASRFKNADGIEKKTRANALFLTACAHWNVQKAIDILDWFASIQIIHNRTESSYAKRTIEYMEDPNTRALIKELIVKADLGINDIGLSDNSKFEQSENVISDNNKVFTLHKKYDANNEQFTYTEFSLNKNESAGTIKYFNILGRLILAIRSGSLVVMDEFDTKFHTLLSKTIVKLFNSEQSSSKAQLFVSSHDTALLDPKLLRRDQIYFVSKNQYGASSVTSLVEYKSRKESPYDKNYLEGKYGAIPFIEELESLLKDGE